MDRARYYGEVKKVPYTPSPAFLAICGAFLGLSVVFFALPHVAVVLPEPEVTPTPFPVTVDPQNKLIEGAGTDVPVLLTLAAAYTAGVDTSSFLASAIMSTKLYEALAPASSPVSVTIQPGMRKEQVATMIDTKLGWSDDQRTIFLDLIDNEGSGEGRLYPSTYLFPASTTPYEAHALIRSRFAERVVARYASTTEARVPMEDALAIASILEREAGSKAEMPIIAGIMWNRLFSDMKLQMDSTLQYARGTSKNGWWPVPRSKDKYVKSEFNTYQNKGLPPTPIASPSVAAILAALNPEKTDCMYFFHSKRTFYCSVTYEEHVAKLKKIYGRGR